MTGKLQIGDFENYRDYLRAWITKAKQESSAVSFRYLSRKAGFSSPNFIKLVMDGDRNLSKESALKLGLALGLTKREQDYFENLVFMNQAKSLEEKKHYFEMLRRLAGSLKIKTLANLEFEYFSKWYIPAIREMLELQDVQNDPQWLAAHLRPPIKTAEAERAISVLRQLALITEHNGKLIKTEQSLTTGGEVRSMFSKAFHAEMIGLGRESIDRFPSEQRDISSLTLSLTKKQYRALKQKIIEFRSDILSMATTDEPTDLVYQFNIQLFPLVEFPRPRGHEAPASTEAQEQR